MIPPEAHLLVCLVNHPRNLEIACWDHWYRIPVKHAPREYLAFCLEMFRDGRLIHKGAGEHPEQLYLGDIAVSMDRCAAQAQQFGHAVSDELALLVVHGVLHLLGYDHHQVGRRRRMWRAQDRAFVRLGRANPLKPGQFLT